MGKVFRVALALRTEMIPPAQTFFLGAHKYAHTRSNWKIVWQDGTSRLTWEGAVACEPDGILGLCAPGQRIAQASLGKARVVILNNEPCDLPMVVADGMAAARRGAEYLLKRRLKNFAFVGDRDRYFSQQREEGFLRGLWESGHRGPVPAFQFHKVPGELPALRKWLLDLPLPCGVFCANDVVGMLLIHRCLELGLQVPEDLAILGVANDEMVCVEAPVTLSSVEQHFESVGYAAAELLDKLLQGGSAPPGPILIPPGEVVERESTRTFGVADPLVRQALMIIHEEHSEPLTMPALLAQLGSVSQRLVELRFKETLGRSPYQEILQTRIAHAQRLLRATRLSLEEIAYRAGFTDPTVFSRHFRKVCEQTPSQYRRRYRQ